MRITWLYLLNRCFLQWFFVRLARIIDESGKQVGWKLLTGIVPETGWSDDYRYWPARAG